MVQNTFDVLGGVMYAGCATIEASIFVSQAVWLVRTRNIRARAKEADSSWAEFPEAQEWQQGGLKLTWRGLVTAKHCWHARIGDSETRMPELR